MKIAVMQPYLFPYLGYFQLIDSVDKFILLDDVAYINKGWINRNRILINGKDQFFIMPLEKASQNKTIKSLTLVKDVKWKNKLEKTIQMAYKKCSHYNDFFPLFQDILYYENNDLSNYLTNSIKKISNYLNIKTAFVDSSSIYNNAALKGQERIIDICLKENAENYINASGGILLYDKTTFKSKGINIGFLQAQIFAYNQLVVEDFIPGLSIIDVLMNNSTTYVQEQLNNFIIN